jgi:hypothetical protein
MRAHDPYVRLLLDRILAGHGELLQEFPLRPRATRRVDGVFVPGERRADAIPLGAMARIAASPAILEAHSSAVGGGGVSAGAEQDARHPQRGGAQARDGV